MNNISFLRESLQNLKTIGTVTRSSKYLCKGMTKHVDFTKANMIVELGAGDGVITKHILADMRPEAKLLAFEVNDRFCDVMRAIPDDRLTVAEDSAEKLGEYLAEMGEGQVDCIISAIPFVSLPKELGQRIVATCKQYLRPGGKFIQVHYSLLAKSLYEDAFGNVDISWVPLNIPPAFVLVSENR